MAHTTVATGATIARKLYQSELVFRDIRKESFFAKFRSPNGSNLVYEQRDFTKEKGETMIFAMPLRVGNVGWRTGAQTVKDNEVALTIRDFSVTLERYRLGIKDDGDLTRRRPAIDLTDSQKRSLIDAGAEKEDSLAFDALYSSSTKILYGGSATSTATIAAGDKVTPSLLSKAKLLLMTGDNYTQPAAQPIKVDGRMFWIALLPPEAEYDLKQDSTYAQAVREAEVRGKDNPIFTGATGVWDGVIVHSHVNCPTYETWGATSDIKGGKIAVVGASALVDAVGATPDVVEEWEDYQEFLGMCFRMTKKIAKPYFTNAAGSSKDYAMVEIDVAVSDILS